MNRFLFYRRIRGPIFLLTFGVTALLAQWDVLGFSQSWPLYLIVFGVLRLVEGAALYGVAPPAYPAQSYTPQGYANPGYANPGYANPGYSPAEAAPVAPVQGSSSLATIQASASPIAPPYRVTPEEER